MTHTPHFLSSLTHLAQSLGLLEFRRSLGVFESLDLLKSLVWVHLSCNIRSFVIELDYGYRYLLEIYSELSSICFLSWLRYHSILALYDRPVLEMVSLLFLELYQLLQYSYDCSSVMSVHPECGGSARDTIVSLTSVDMVSRLSLIHI